MVYVYYKGARFGNWLFQYAVAKTLAKGGPVAFYFDDPNEERVLESYDALFGDVERVFALPPNTVVLTDDMVNRNGLDAYRMSENLAILGLVQNPAYFKPEYARAAYAVPTAIDTDIHGRCAGMFAYDNRVSIHVRRGDYLKLPHRFPFVGEDYLKKAVSQFPENSLFVVCSDDIPWCKSFFSPARFPRRKFFFSEGGSVLSDFYVPTYCHHNICSNSTFSWWSSWLNPHPDKRVLMPKRWFGSDVRQSGERFYYDGVEVIESHLSCGMVLKIALRLVQCWIGKVLRKCGLIR